MHIIAKKIKSIREDRLKGGEGDVFDEINGSAGIQSNADSMIVISSDRRIGKNPVLSCLPKMLNSRSLRLL